MIYAWNRAIDLSVENDFFNKISKTDLSYSLYIEKTILIFFGTFFFFIYRVKLDNFEYDINIIWK